MVSEVEERARYQSGKVNVGTGTLSEGSNQSRTKEKGNTTGVDLLRQRGAVSLPTFFCAGDLGKHQQKNTEEGEQQNKGGQKNRDGR